MRAWFASVVAAGLARVSRLRGGGATSLPGLVALRIDRGLIRKRSQELAGTIVVTGTNGKTTTARMIGEILTAAGHPVIHNQAGSNLLRGIASALALHRPSPKARAKTFGLFEVDEATMPDACRELQPQVVVVTNLFRDQLDRYGELRQTAEFLKRGLAALPKDSTVILNADDPLVASLGQGLKQTVQYYGIEDTSVSKRGLPAAADSVTDPHTGALLRYEAVFVGHLGHYVGGGRGLKRPRPNVRLESLQLDAARGSKLTIKAGRRTLKFPLKLPGIYSAYNALAAVATGLALEVPEAKIKVAITKTAAAFGRLEHVTVGKRKIIISLIKNPTGTDEVIHTLLLDKRPKDVLILINDNFADGTDVSWLWDAQFETLVPGLRHVAVGGTRVDDMALRLKYAGVPEADIGVYRDLPDALQRSLKTLPANGTLYVLPTYTAMLELRRHLVRGGHIKHYLH